MIPIRDWIALNSRTIPKMLKSPDLCASVLYGACRMRDLFHRELEESDALRAELVQVKAERWEALEALSRERAKMDAYLSTMGRGMP
jgi:hypothetical protein